MPHINIVSTLESNENSAISNRYASDSEMKTAYIKSPLKFSESKPLMHNNHTSSQLPDNQARSSIISLSPNRKNSTTILGNTPPSLLQNLPRARVYVNGLTTNIGNELIRISNGFTHSSLANLVKSQPSNNINSGISTNCAGKFVTSSYGTNPHTSFMFKNCSSSNSNNLNTKTVISGVPAMAKITKLNAPVHIDVGGTTYTTTLETLTKDSESRLAKLFNGTLPIVLDSFKQHYFIDRDGKLFRHIINYLRNTENPCKNSKDSDSKNRHPLLLPKNFEEWDLLLAEAEYFHVAAMIKDIKAYREQKISELNNHTPDKLVNGHVPNELSILDSSSKRKLLSTRDNTCENSCNGYDDSSYNKRRKSLIVDNLLAKKLGTNSNSILPCSQTTTHLTHHNNKNSYQNGSINGDTISEGDTIVILVKRNLEQGKMLLQTQHIFLMGSSLDYILTLIPSEAIIHHDNKNLEINHTTFLAKDRQRTVSLNIKQMDWTQVLSILFNNGFELMNSHEIKNNDANTNICEYIFYKRSTNPLFED